MKRAIPAVALAAVSALAAADDRTLGFDGGSASFDSSGVVLSDGNDRITLGGLEAGLYDFTLTLSAQHVGLSSASLNGVHGAILNGRTWSFVGIAGTSSSVFTLALDGIAPSARAMYSGELTATRVPELQTYALMLAGLGAVGFIAHRRRQE